MKLLFELSKEHDTLPVQEIKSLFNTYSIPFKVIYQDMNVLILDAYSNEDISLILTKRLAYTYSISEFLFSSSLDKEEIYSISRQHPCKNPGSIAVRYRNRSLHQDSQQIIHILASVYTKKRTVNLTSPDVEIQAIITDDMLYVGRLIYVINRKQYDKRKVQFRPFFSPISLHPRIARGLVNLSYVKQNDIVLDPFCGTGGFLIEAGLMGCKLYGSDIQQEMIEGTIKNLESYSIKNYNIFRSDIGDIQQYIDEPINAIVTDAPYGKSTTTNKESIYSLYLRTFESISSILQKDGYLVIGLPDLIYRSLYEDYFQLSSIIKIPVHRSLTRYFLIGKKKGP